jgi:hypothetical protein
MSITTSPPRLDARGGAPRPRRSIGSWIAMALVAGTTVRGECGTTIDTAGHPVQAGSR